MKRNKFNHIYVEITNNCNLQCPFCSIDKRLKQVMSLSDFERICEAIKPYTTSIYLHVKGEPLIHPNFSDILKISEKHGLTVKLTTNGTLLSEKGSIILASPIIKRLNISLQALITMTHFERLVYLDDLRKFLCTASLQGTFSISLRLWNDEKQTDIIELNGHIRDYFRTNFHCDDWQNGQMLIPHVYLSKEDEFVWPEQNISINEAAFKCLGGKTHLAILVDGTVTLCCLDATGATKIGNVFAESFEKIINSEPYQSALVNFTKHEAFFEVCKKCTYRNRFVE